MKKFFSIAVMIAALLTITSCGDDEPKEKTIATATYTLSFSQDMLDACNVFIIFKAENGRNVMEPVSTTWWTKTVTSDKFPAEFGVYYNLYTKTEDELTKEKYDLACEFNFNVKTNKGASYSNKVTVINSTGVAKNRVQSTIERISGKSTGFKVTENGIVSEANNLKYD